MTGRRALTAAVVLAAAVACGDGASRDAATGDTAIGVVDGPGPAAPAPAGAADALPPLTDQSVQAVVDAINAADAQLAGLAVAKAADLEVKRFASRIASAHRQKVTDRAPPRGDPTADALVAPLRDVQAAAAPRLTALPAGPAFDAAWVALQVDVHERALALLDRVAPAATTGSLPTLVAGTRERVAEHLSEARALQERLR